MQYAIATLGSHTALQILKGAKDGIIVYDKDLRYRIWNPFMENVSGKSEKEVLGRQAEEVFPFLREVGQIAVLEKVLQEGIVIENEFSTILPDRRRIWNRNASTPLKNPAGKIIGVIKKPKNR